MTRVVNGGVLVFFSSYKLLTEAHEYWSSTNVIDSLE